MYHDGVIHPHPPVSRCLHDTVDALKRAGHTVVPWDPKLHKDIVGCVEQAYFLDGGEEYHEVLEAGNEPQVPLLKWILDRAKAESWEVRETWNVCVSADRLWLCRKERTDEHLHS